MANLRHALAPAHPGLHHANDLQLRRRTEKRPLRPAPHGAKHRRPEVHLDPVEKLKVALLPLSSGRVSYPDFDGDLSIESVNGRYTRISAFTRNGWDSIF